MAKIIGEANSTLFLQRKLRRVNLPELQSFEDINTFHRNFPTIIQERKEQEKHSLDSELVSLKSEEEELTLLFEQHVSERKNSLFAEKKELYSQIKSYYEADKNKASGVRSKVVVKYQRKTQKIEKKINKQAEKPFKKEKKKIHKVQKKYGKLEKNFDKIVEKNIAPLNKAEIIIEKNWQFLAGATGEEAVIRVLSKLSDEYYIFNDKTLRLSKSVRWRKYNEYVRSAQVDHIIVGPTGVFLIETKNWSQKTLDTTRFHPHKQVDRANFIFYIIRQKKFKKLPVYNVVVMLGNVSKIYYKFVDQVSLRELIPYIVRRKRQLHTELVTTVVRWLMSI